MYYKVIHHEPKTGITEEKEFGSVSNLTSWLRYIDNNDYEIVKIEVCEEEEQ